MTSTRSILVVLPGEGPLDAEQVKTLNAAYDLRFVSDPEALARLIEEHPEAMIIGTLRHAQTIADSPGAAASESIGQGVAIVNDRGQIGWENARFSEVSDAVRKQFIISCRTAMASWGGHANDAQLEPARSTIASDDAIFEVIVSPGPRSETEPINSAVGVLVDITEQRRFEQRLAEVQAAGASLMKFDSTEIADLNMAERLWKLEDKIVDVVHDLLHHEHFEIRLLNRRTGQLELAVAVGISPLKIGESMFARKEGNGISGYVAATGLSYICPDVASDPHYRAGLGNASASLTVPLKLHDRIVGVFNIESARPNAFDESDRIFAESIASDIAMAMNVLDLLVAERSATSERASASMKSELDQPLGEISNEARALLKSANLDDSQKSALNSIIDAAAQVRKRVDRCASGPRTVLEAEQALRTPQIDPKLAGKRILVADDEAGIRDTVSQLLADRGCDVTVCGDGKATIEQIESDQGRQTPFDLVISDIRMPNRNGYEVFQAAKNINPDTAVILMTGFGYDPHHSIVRASQEGLHSFLFKPFKASQLLEEVGKALAGKPCP